MMRQQLIRSLRRSQRLPGVNATNSARAFSTTGQRNAEVELTIDGKKVSIEGMIIVAREDSLDTPGMCFQRLTEWSYSGICTHPSMREGRCYHPSLLLP
jgi:hypothetical protein